MRNAVQRFTNVTGSNREDEKERTSESSKTNIVQSLHSIVMNITFLMIPVFVVIIVIALIVYTITSVSILPSHNVLTSWHTDRSTTGCTCCSCAI